MCRITVQESLRHSLCQSSQPGTILWTCTSSWTSLDLKPLTWTVSRTSLTPSVSGIIFTNAVHNDTLSDDVFVQLTNCSVSHHSSLSDLARLLTRLPTPLPPHYRMALTTWPDTWETWSMSPFFVSRCFASLQLAKHLPLLEWKILIFSCMSRAIQS